jgi:hypothetical protein
MSCRLVVLGGSAVSTVQLIDALAAWPGGQARRPDGLELVLHGRSSRLAAVADACRMRAGTAAGLQARSVDESYPREFGIPGEETMGPGGLACAVRTIGALRPFWAQVAHRARAALVINLTNLADIVQRAARTEVGLRIVTACDSPLGLLNSVACRRWWSIEGQGGFRSPQFHQVPAGQGLKLSQDASGRSSDVRFWGRCESRSWSAPASSRPRKPRDTPVTAPSSCVVT